MPFEYNGENAQSYQNDEWSYVLNGALASSTTFRKIAMNQTWLAVQDTEAMNFFTSTAGQSPTIPTYNAIRILMAPFSQYVEFWFLCERNGDDTGQPYVYIELNSAETGNIRRQSLVFGGSNPTGKGVTWEGSREARWIMFMGTVGGAGGNDDALALKVINTPVNTWTEVNVTFAVSDLTGIGGDIRIFTGFYRVLPVTGPLPSWA